MTPVERMEMKLLKFKREVMAAAAAEILTKKSSSLSPIDRFFMTKNVTVEEVKLLIDKHFDRFAGAGGETEWKMENVGNIYYHMAHIIIGIYLIQIQLVPDHIFGKPAVDFQAYASYSPARFGTVAPPKGEVES